MSSLNPVLPVGLQLTEAVVEHQRVTQPEADRRATEMLDLVGIANAAQRMRAYPHQFSGGQLQRVGIAMALVCKPSILIADEPTTALDVTIQAGIVELVARLQKPARHGDHLDQPRSQPGGRLRGPGGGDVRREHRRDCAGRRLFDRTAHPYTAGLLDSVPGLEGRGRLLPIRGAPPNLLVPPASCPFAPRCDYEVPRCLAERPPLAPVGAGPRQRLLGVAAGAGHRLGQHHPAHRDSTPSGAGPPGGAGLQVHYPVRQGVLRRQVGAVRAVDGVSFEVRRGETLALVGESGCGKSTTGRAILGLQPIAGGHVVFDGVDYRPRPRRSNGSGGAMMQMIFQNPYGALNPRMTVGRIVGEGLRAQRWARGGCRTSGWARC